jgi:phosphate/sulfate permease
VLCAGCYFFLENDFTNFCFISVLTVASGTGLYCFLFRFCECSWMQNTDIEICATWYFITGSCVWLIAATLLRLPVSATHSIVGATVGFALVAHGAKGIRWYKLGMISRCMLRLVLLFCQFSSYCLDEIWFSQWLVM